jgi:hypothetical protein
MDRPRVASRKNDDLEKVGLALLYPALEWSVCAGRFNICQRQFGQLRLTTTTPASAANRSLNLQTR